MSDSLKTRSRTDKTPLTLRTKLWGISLFSRALIGALASTIKVETCGEEHMNTALHSGKPIVITCWHENILAFLFYRLSTQLPHAFTMISQSRDGDIGTAVMKNWGIEAVRASSSRGGAVGLLQFCRRLQRNDYRGQSAFTGITVDGPRGPKRQSKPGILTLGKRGGALLLPSATDCAPNIKLGSWDRLPVPLPFSRCRIQFGKPISLDAPPTLGEDSVQTEARSNSIDYRPDLTPEQLDQILSDLTATCAID